MVAGSRCAPLPAGRVASPVQVQGYPHHLEVAEDLSGCFLFDLVDEALHGLGELGKVTAHPLTIEFGRHGLVVLGGDVDDARHMADVAIVGDAVDGRNEFILQVPNVFVVLTILVAQIGLAVQEGDDDRVFELDVERCLLYTSPSPRDS